LNKKSDNTVNAAVKQIAVKMSRVPIQAMAKTSNSLVTIILRYSSVDLLNWMLMNLDPIFKRIIMHPAKNLLSFK